LVLDGQPAVPTEVETKFRTHGKVTPAESVADLQAVLGVASGLLVEVSVYADRHSLLHLFHNREFLGELVSAARPEADDGSCSVIENGEVLPPDRNTDRSPERWSAQEGNTAGCGRDWIGMSTGETGL
jgi:hypothetical protein